MRAPAAAPAPGSALLGHEVLDGAVAAVTDDHVVENLDAEELEQYDVLLEEQAFPFEEKAIGIHERNARLAAQGVYDEWLQKSYAELAPLKPGRYARAEVADAPAAPLAGPPPPPEADLWADRLELPHR